MAPAWDPNALGGKTIIVLKSFTDTLGRTTQYQRSTPLNQNATWHSVRRPANPTVDAIRVNYGSSDGQGHLSAQVLDALGRSWNYTRTGGGPGNYSVVTRTDPLNKSRLYEFDPNGMLIRFRDETLKQTWWRYYSEGFPPTDEYRQNGGTAQWEGGATQWEYDSRGNVTKTTVKTNLASPAPDIVTRAQYPVNCVNPKTCNKPITTTDARNNVTDYTYDATHGGLLTVTQPEPASGKPRPQVRYSYDTVAGAYVVTGVSSCRTTAICTGTADETKVTLGYGSNGLLPTSTTVQSGDGALQSTVTSTYDAFGNRTIEDGALSGNADTVHRTYDRAGQLKTEIAQDPDGAGALRRVASRYTYDDNGRRTLVEAGTVPSQATDATNFTVSQTLQTAYDLNGQIVRETATGGTTQQVVQRSYDLAGQLDCTAVRMNPAAFATLPASACDLGTPGSAGPDRITKYAYDDAGRPTKVTAGYGTATPIDEVTQAYGNNGKPISVTDARGNTTSYAYDGFDRLLTTTFPGGSYEQFGYDNAGNVVSRRMRDNKMLGFGYDALNRLVSVDRPNTVYGETDRTYGYDNYGQLTQAQDSSGRTLGFLYDALGRKTSQTDSAYTLGNASFLYDAAGRRTRFTWGDGSYVSYDYRNTGELSAIRNSGGTALTSFSYNDLGQRTGIQRSNGAQTQYGYDGLSQPSQLVQDINGSTQDLTVNFTRNSAGQIVGRSASNNAYAWDGNVNVNRSYDANALNQITRSGSTTIGYDTRGNLTSAGSDTYVYTADNQLATALGVNLDYDPLGRLSKGVLDKNGPTIALVYDGPNLIAEIDQTSGALLRRYAHGLGADEPLIWYEGSNLSNVRWLHADERGSVIAITDAAGSAVAINSYDPFGIPGVNNNLGRFRYTGQQWLSNIGLYDYKARTYSPSLGRFMQTDPIGYGDGTNLYQYAGADPVNSSDPTGLSQCYYNCLYAEYVGYYGHSSGGSSLPAGNWGPGSGPKGFDGWNALQALAPKPLPTQGQCGIYTQNGIRLCEPSRAKPDPQKTDARNRLVCKILSDNSFNLEKAWDASVEYRNPTGPVDNWQSNDNYRNAENFLYAAYTGVDKFSIWARQTIAKPIWRFTGIKRTTPYSIDALQAGYDGRDHYGQNKKQLGDWCASVTR